MSLSSCPGCGLPREADGASRPCPLCGWDPSRPAEAQPAPAPPPPSRLTAEPTAPPEPTPRKRSAAPAVLALAAVGCLLALILFLLTSDQKPPTKPAEAETAAEAVVPHIVPPVVAVAPKVPTLKTPEPPEPVRPPAKPVDVAPWPEVAAVAQKAREPRRSRTTIPFLAADAVVLDGGLGDWKELTPLTLTPVDRGRGPKKPVVVPRTQKAYLAYCPDGLLVAAEVTDTSGALENEPRPEKGMWAFWDNDAVEVFIDTLHARDADRGAPHHHQFFAFPFGSRTDDGVGGYESKIIKRDWTVVPVKGEGGAAIRRAGRKTATGWTIEMLIPRAALRQSALKPGSSLGVEVQVDTGTGVYYFWACDDPGLRVSMHPHAWGEVVLGGSDARIELLDAAGKPTGTPVAGEPLTVRVTDLDLALAPGGRDGVSVVVRSQTGVERVVALTETAAGSGVFVGNLATRPAPGVRPAGLLEVSAGDRVTVEYVEPLRANGDRDRVLRAGFDVAAGTKE